MSKIKICYLCLALLFFVLIIFSMMKIKNKEEFQQKTVLAQEIRKVLGVLMIDLREAHENTIQDLPADGLWHNRIAFGGSGQVSLEYFIKERHLFRINNGNRILIADNIGGLRIRRQKESPDILEVQIKAQNNATLISNLKIRIHS